MQTSPQPRWYAMRMGKWGLMAICLIASVAAPPCVAADSPPRGILIVEDSDPGSPFGRRFREQIHLTLDAETTRRSTIYSEFLDLGHFNGSDYESMMHGYFNQKYQNKRIDVIVTLGSESLKFVSSLRADKWPAASIVFVTFDDSVTTRSMLPPNSTGIIAPRRFKKLVESAQLLVPHLASIVLLGETLKRQPFRHYQSELQEFAKDLNIIDLTGLPLVEVQTRIATLPDDTAIVYIPIYNDKIGISHNPGEALMAIADIANRPIVVDSEDLIGKGATGGIVMSSDDLGREVGRRVARILNGEDASSLPIADKDFTRPVFDDRQFRRWGVSETTLPVGSELRFRELSVWERYRWYILTAFIVIVAQGLIIAWLIYERRRRHFAEHESRQHLLEVTQMDRAMAASVMSASVSHELKQPLAAIYNNAEAAEILLSGESLDRNELKEIVADIRRDDQRAVEIINHLRTLLRQGDIQPRDVNLTEVLTDTLELIKPQAAKQGATLVVEPVLANLWVRADSVHIQQVLLNLAFNALDAMQKIPVGKRKLRLGVSSRDTEVIVSIADSGTGIPADKLNSIFEPFVTTKQQGTGLGLSISRTIIGAYGGKIWAENEASGGAIFRFTLRLARVEAA